MDLTFIDNKEQWNRYIIANATRDGGFLQSWEWGEFQKAYGRRVWRVGAVENSEIVYGWQIIEMPLPFGLRYWYVPRLVRNQESGIRNQEFFIKKIIELARNEGSIFVRVDGGGDDLEKFGFKKVNVSVQPEEDLIIDITKSEELMLAEMKPKTRYNIRLAEKHEVKVSSELRAQSSELFEIFWQLIQKTSKRQGIKPHPPLYYEKMLEVLTKDNTATLYTAEYQDKIIAANLVTYFGKTATYLHGGSDDEYKNVMAPYLLHWQAICDAKSRGYSYYNFGGVSLEKKSWEGITRFKTGFCPKAEFVKYGRVWDLPTKKCLYKLYWLFKRFWFKLL